MDREEMAPYESDGADEQLGSLQKRIDAQSHRIDVLTLELLKVSDRLSDSHESATWRRAFEERMRTIESLIDGLQLETRLVRAIAKSAANSHKKSHGGPVWFYRCPH